MGEFKQIQEILNKLGTEFYKIDEEMTEKNEAKDGNSISSKRPWHMKWDIPGKQIVIRSRGSRVPNIVTPTYSNPSSVTHEISYVEASKGGKFEIG